MKSHRKGVEVFSNRSRDLLSAIVGLVEANTGKLTPTVRPHLLTSSQSDKGLGSAPVVFPILLILGTDKTEVDGQPGFPLTAALSTGNTWDIGHPVRQEARIIHGNDPA